MHKLKLKFGGIDWISAETLKILAESIADPLVHIINKSIELALWPEKLKLAQIKPIPKGGEDHLLTNQMPISLISNLAKIYEKIIYNRIYIVLSVNTKYSLKNNLVLLKNLELKMLWAK